MKEGPNFMDLSERFLNTYACHLKSYRDYKGYLASLTQFFALTPVREITGQMIQEYGSWRSHQVTLSSTNRCLAILSKSLHCAQDWGWLTSVPRIRKFPEPQGREIWLNGEQEEEVLRKCPAWLREIATVAIYSGMRLSEILELQWSGVDLTRGVIQVMHSKNGDRRSLPIHLTVRRILEAKSREFPYVFSDPQGRKRPNWQVSSAFRRAVGQTDLRFHDLRHTFGSRLAQNNVSLLKIQKLMGHKTPTMTARYSHHDTESLRAAIDQL